jgi:D-alanyl-D-alanine carboxypeptidase
MSAQRSGRIAACLVALAMLFGPILCSGASAQIGSDRYSSIVMDARTGAILSAANPEELRHPASLTKIMTVYLAFEAMRDGRVRGYDMITVSPVAAAEPRSRLGLVTGSQLTVQQAVMAMITKSANDASTALAEHMGGSEERFARMMTAKARQLGMRDTVFRNAHGLPDRAQVTTARDMAILGRRLISDFPDEYRQFSAPSFSFRGRTHYNHNRLLASYEGADGIKTGFINDSGYNLVASVEREGHRVIAVVFGASSNSQRDAHMVALLDRAFDSLDVREARVRPPVLGLVSVAQAAPVRPGAAAPPARTVRPAAVAAPARTWGIQVGAFASRTDAARAAGDAARVAGQPARAKVEPAGARQRKVFRAQVVNLTQAEAQGACSAQARKRMPCMTLRPGERPEIAAAR